MSHAPHAITTLTLENFRNYRTLSLTLPPHPVVLRGKNGAGKTNILEALSLLSPGRGFRGARLREMDANNAGGAPWVVATEVTTAGETSFIGTGRDGESSAEKRIIKINGGKVRGHAALANHVCIQWLTPSMDQVFIEGGSARRKLLDRIVYGFVPEHATRVQAYESAMRERNRLLTDRMMADPYWLSVLEQQMAEHAVAITLARQEVLERLRHELVEKVAGFPRALVSLNGLIEDWLEEGESALEAERKFAERLTEVRNLDTARVRASIGPQRSDFKVIHCEKNLPAESCSTGEQKALLLSLMLAAARARAAWCNVPPILLLDEVIAHLDVDKRASLFDLIRATRIQAWMTGTDAADFKGLEGFSTILEIDGGTVKI
ncbi:MAG: DNA replication/repair protein RecF [Rickettsiales bacterium]